MHKVMAESSAEEWFGEKGTLDSSRSISRAEGMGDWLEVGWDDVELSKLQYSVEEWRLAMTSDGRI